MAGVETFTDKDTGEELVKSELLNSFEPCTIFRGIVGSDGQRYGALADIDAFAIFNWEDGHGEVEILDVYQGLVRYGATGWNQGASRVDPMEDTGSPERQARVDELAAFYDLMEELPEDQRLIAEQFDDFMSGKVTV